MIGQHHRFVVRCPVCGRALRVAEQHVGVKVVCSHCRGPLIVHKLPVEVPVATATPISPRPAASCSSLFQPRRGRCCSLSIQCGQSMRTARIDGQFRRRVPARPPTRLYRVLAVRQEGREAGIVLAEPRNEVFARLATDVTRTGVSVLQASSAEEALRYAARFAPPLVIANADLPDSSAWLLAAKLRLCVPSAPLWIYAVHPSDYYRRMARFLKVDTLISYRGDLWGLSAAILNCLACRRTVQRIGEANSGRKQPNRRSHRPS